MVVLGGYKAVVFSVRWLFLMLHGWIYWLDLLNIKLNLLLNLIFFLKKKEGIFWTFFYDLVLVLSLFLKQNLRMIHHLKKNLIKNHQK